MKLFMLVIAIIIAATGLVSAQKKNDGPEQEIRRLEQSQVDALLRNDLAAIERNWSKDYTVNNPFSQVVKASEGPIRAGTLTYSSFIREIEKILFHEKAVIVMGKETVVPSGTSADAGKTINRRFTNVWMKKNGKWLLTARHASVICQN